MEAWLEVPRVSKVMNEIKNAAAEGCPLLCHRSFVMC